MVKKSKRELYSGVSIPIDTMNEIEEYRKDHPEKKYRSRAEFIIEAIRQKMDKDIAIDAIKKTRDKDYKERYDKAFFEKYGITPEEDNKPGDFSFKNVDIPSGEPTIEELEERINSLEKKFLTKNDIKKITQNFKEVIKIQEEVIKKSANIIAVEGKIDKLLIALEAKK